MLLSAEKIFDMNQDEFYTAVAEPKCAEEFRRSYILPAIAAHSEDGDALDAAYGRVIGAYQRGAFVVGFTAAVQLLMGCMADNETKRNEELT